MKGRRIYNIIQRALITLDYPDTITITSIAESGRIHFIKEGSKRNGISAKEYLSTPKFRYEVEDRYGEINSINTYLMKYNDYL